ncbi:MAG: hypothetical protein WB586_21945 [Chthoniobacterales bacterium]
MADSLIGLIGNSLTRLDPMLEYGVNRLARENPKAMTPEAAVFYKGGRFSAVRTLSPKSPALIALSELPIEVPYHSVIGQHHPGPKEQGSDVVVPYWSSHLDGAQSEVIVRSGHGVFSNLDAVLETIRILHLEQRSSKSSTWRSSSSHRPIFSTASPSQSQSRQPSPCCARLAAQPELDPRVTAQSRTAGLSKPSSAI